VQWTIGHTDVGWGEFQAPNPVKARLEWKESDLKNAVHAYQHMLHGKRRVLIDVQRGPEAYIQAPAGQQPQHPKCPAAGSINSFHFISHVFFP